MSDTHLTDDICIQLYELLETKNLSQTEKQTQVLELGIDYLEMEYGVIQRHQPDTQTDRIIVSVGADVEPFQSDAMIDCATSQCPQTRTSQVPVTITDLSQLDQNTNLPRDCQDDGCYIGTTYVSENDIRGTVWFSSPTPRGSEFTADETLFIELLARIVGQLLSDAPPNHRSTHSGTTAEQNYETLLAQMSEAVVIADPQTGDIVDVNEPTVALSGYEKSTLVGMPVAELYKPDVRV